MHYPNIIIHSLGSIFELLMYLIQNWRLLFYFKKDVIYLTWFAMGFCYCWRIIADLTVVATQCSGIATKRSITQYKGHLMWLLLNGSATAKSFRDWFLCAVQTDQEIIIVFTCFFFISVSFDIRLFYPEIIYKKRKMSLKVLVGRLDPRKSIWEVDMENMEERINARRERIRKRIGIR